MERVIGIKEVQRVIEDWKRSLLDLSKRNRLLYFKSGRATRIQISSPPPEDLYKSLVEEEKTLDFPYSTGAEIWGFNLKDSLKEKIQIMGGDLSLSSPIETLSDLRDLFKKLERLRRGTKTIFEEQGVHTLFLALGAIRWVDRETEEEVLSPLLLLPVTLERTKERFKIRAFEEEVEVNPVFAYFLKTNFGITLPEFEEENEEGDSTDIIGNYFAKVRKKIGNIGGELRKETWLAQFAFHKLPMYRDLEGEEVAKLAKNHPVVFPLCGGTSAQEKTKLEIREIENLYASPETFPVLDADSSQLEVLERVRRGETIVVQGPPGTGKSQTIVNIIAQSLREGKKVLFLSEKRAALEVVFRRLNEVGLTNFCLDLHSHQTNRRNIVEGLLATLGDLLQIRCAPDLSKFEEYRKLREELEKYVIELDKPRDRARRNAYDIQGILARLSDVPFLSCSLPFERVLGVSPNLENEFKELINKISSLGIWDREKDHPWRDSEPEPSFFALPEVIRKSFGNLEENCSSLIEYITSGELQNLITSTSKTQEALLRTLGIDLNILEGKAKELLRVFSQRESAGPFKRFWIDQKLKNFLKKKVGRGFSRQNAVLAIETFKSYLNLKNAVAQNGSLQQIIFSFPENITFSELERLQKELAWISRIFTIVEGKKSRKQIEGLYSLSSRENLNNANKSFEKFSRFLCDLKTAWEDKNILQLYPRGLGGKPFKEIPIKEIKDRAEKGRQEPEKLQEWVTYRGLLLEAQKRGLESFLKECRDQNVGSENITRAFFRAYFTKWLEEVYIVSPVLREFHFKTQEELQRKFRELDKNLQKEAVKVVVQKVAENLQRSIPKSEEARLRLEAAKRRRQMPLRRLFLQIPNLLLSLKPCLMMSPLSVATYLPKDFFSFDLVIFDEASQLLPGDAIGALLRSKQAVIFGDKKQLPPTDFFQAHVESQEEEEESARDFESILDIAGAYFPGPMLKWHYRSRDERLIAFSNQKFYQGNLVTFPAPGKGKTETGVSFIFIPEGLFERGGSRTNVAEARKAAELVLAHFRNQPHKSLGVISMSIEQRDAIEEALNRLLEENPDIVIPENEKEPFFIKNLETVQGDERDVIIFSIGYGPNEPGGRPIIHFGPINREGGERRLNVAITRARYKMMVITSINPDHFVQVQSKWEGPQLLADYLRYAKSCDSEKEDFEIIQKDTNIDSLTEFEKVVRDFLLQKGYQVDCKIGVSTYKIDLAVKDPEDPTRYLLGIECDGPIYLKAQTTRDRERIRREVLENLGWNLCRVWSTDWIKNPKEAGARLIEQIEKAKQDKGKKRANMEKINDPPNDQQDSPKGLIEKYLKQIHSSSTPQNTISPLEEKTTSVNFPPYEIYKGSYRFGKLTSEWGGNLADILTEIVNCESPIHVEEAFQRALSLYEEKRLGSRIRRKLSEALKWAIQNNKIKMANQFLFAPGKKEITPRGAGDWKRPPEHIHSKEWEAAVKEALKQLGVTPKDELARLIAEAMGFGRLAKDVLVPIEEAIESLKAKGKLRENERMLYLKE